MWYTAKVLKTIFHICVLIYSLCVCVYIYIYVDLSLNSIDKESMVLCNYQFFQDSWSDDLIGEKLIVTKHF